MRVVNEEFGKLLRSRRQQAKITQSELAKRAGLTSAAISKIETGGQTVSLDLLYRFASGLSLPPTALLPDAALIAGRIQGLYADDVQAEFYKKALGNE